MWQFEATSVGNQANGQFSYAHQERRQEGKNREMKQNVILMHETVDVTIILTIMVSIIIIVFIIIFIS